MKINYRNILPHVFKSLGLSIFFLSIAANSLKADGSQCWNWPCTSPIRDSCGDCCANFYSPRYSTLEACIIKCEKQVFNCRFRNKK